MIHLYCVDRALRSCKKILKVEGMLEERLYIKFGCCDLYRPEIWLYVKFVQNKM